MKIFELSECKLNLNLSDCRASKIIWNDTKVDPISWEPSEENPLKFCVGISVGGHPHEIRKDFDISRIRMIYWISSKFSKPKKSLTENLSFWGSSRILIVLLKKWCMKNDSAWRNPIRLRLTVVNRFIRTGNKRVHQTFA